MSLNQGNIPHWTRSEVRRRLSLARLGDSKSLFPNLLWIQRCIGTIRAERKAQGELPIPASGLGNTYDWSTYE